jgi:hypothetical protein
MRQTVLISPTTRDYLCAVIDSETTALPTVSLNTAEQQDLEKLLHLHLTARLGHELKSYAFLHL